MEFEMSDNPGHFMADEVDDDTIEDRKALRNGPSVRGYPDRRDRALHIPEEGD